MKTFDNQCDQHTRCTIRHPLARINERIFKMLDLISLAEINRDDTVVEKSFLPVTQGV
jgi:DNA-binding IscR family transcriptional regulator